MRYGGLTVAEVRKYITVRVSKLPDYHTQNRNVSKVEVNRNLSLESGIYGHDGKEFIVYFPNWHQISESNLEMVINAQKAESMNNNIVSKN